MSTAIARRDFIRTAGFTMASLALAGCREKYLTRTLNCRRRKPNIVFLLADDLGYAELGCYGQKKIKTPNIDKLASLGMKFTQHYSGSPVCAPSRCTLMTGQHTGHAQIRNNKPIGGKEGWRLGSTTGGQWPIKADTITVAKILKQAGYTTGAFGKWGLGTVNSTGNPNKQGFDYFYGYICQRQAHTYYPNHLWRNDKIEWLDVNKDGKKTVYSHDLIVNEALNFIRQNKDRPFFLYVPFTIPHVALQVPEDSLAQYKGKWPDPPYDGKKGYFSHPHPRACYAAMVSRMDRDVGRIISLLKKSGIEDNTLVVFTSDNGPTFNGGADSKFFESTGPLRGLKCSVYEGGIRVPFIAKWPGKIRPASKSEHISAFWDFLPTCCDIIGAEHPKDIDGISILPTLLGTQEEQKKNEYLYWEYRGWQSVRLGDFKGIRPKNSKKIELYNLTNDVAEKNNIAAKNPEIISKIAEIMRTARTKSEIFPIRTATKP